MAKNPNGKSSPAKRSESLNGAMIFFLIGCVAEAYLFMVRRFFINGTIDEILAWNDYLKYFAWIGAAVLIVGAVWVFRRISRVLRRVYAAFCRNRRDLFERCAAGGHGFSVAVELL